MKKIFVEEALDDVRALEEKGYGWTIHLVAPEEGDAPLTNAHTHGMSKFGSEDFQLVLPFAPATVGELLNGICAIAATGRKVDEETEIYGFFTTGPARFARFRETGRDVLRAICPDENGKYPWDEGCETPYSEQLRPAFAE